MLGFKLIHISKSGPWNFILSLKEVVLPVYCVGIEYHGAVYEFVKNEN